MTRSLNFASPKTAPPRRWVLPRILAWMALAIAMAAWSWMLTQVF